MRLLGISALTFLSAAALLGQEAMLNPLQPGVYRPPTAGDRLEWFAYSSAGPPSLAGGVISAGWGTLFNKPSEYGTHWEGFGKRYGMRLTGVVTGNAMEASLGALWAEDPRYFRAAGQPFGARVGNVVKMTFLARYRDGNLHPAYARYVATAGNNYLSMTWRAQSEAGADDALFRVGLGFLARMSANAFQEFWPDVKSRVFRSSQ